MTRNSQTVSDWRRRNKARLVEAHGGKCFDCKLEFAPFMFEFDHRNPQDKLFALGACGTISFARQLEESLKCDMVCPNCHRIRTHRQRCTGCEYCTGP